MSTDVLKVEAMATETCCVCGGDGGGGGLRSPEEHDAAMPPGAPALRSVLLHLAHNKAIPSGLICATCAVRATDAYELSAAITARAAPSLSDKIRALRKRLHDLTQKIDVFIVVGSQTQDGTAGAGTYSEEDIIMVERSALAAAAADEELLERGEDARGDHVYQCTVCPETFQRASEFRSHVSGHAASSRHSCWSCGAQFSSREAALRHSALHHASHPPPSGASLVPPSGASHPPPSGASLAPPVDDLRCHLCDQQFESARSASAHSCGWACPCCGAAHASRALLAAHVSARHDTACPRCFVSAPDVSALRRHLALHASTPSHSHSHSHSLRPRHFVCGYDSCILRFATRSTLMSHIRKCHGGEGVEGAEGEAGEAGEEALEGGEGEGAQSSAHSVQCDHCYRTFGSRAAMKRHARVHRNLLQEPPLGLGEGVEEEVEYLEMETLEETEVDVKPTLALL